MLVPVFCSSYFPSIEYLQSCLQFAEIQLECFENYPKQTLRNRCFILSPNGVQCLTVPVQHNGGNKILMKDVKINYEEEWQRQHWRSLEAAYNRSAFFEFYRDDLETIFFRRYDFLIDLNENLFLWMMKKLKHNIIIKRTEMFTDESSFQFLSERKNNAISSVSQKTKPYLQVFAYKFGFAENLSGLDLLFNTGNASIEHLK